MSATKRKAKRKSNKTFPTPHTVADGKYYGDVVDGLRHGFGVLITDSGIYFEGNWENDKCHGYGIKVYPSGDRHEGHYQNGQRCGHGVYLWSCGDKYTGQWDRGRMHGSGIFDWASGDRYSGEWVDGSPHGAGCKWFADGGYLQGVYVQGQAQGYGTKVLSCGDVYAGHFDAGSGWGSYTWTCGDKYTGEWADDRMNGSGEYTVSHRVKLLSNDVVYYNGEYCDSKRHGHGSGTFHDTSTYTGSWKNDLPHGFGVFCYADGTVYEGAVCCGQRHGQGILYGQVLASQKYPSNHHTINIHTDVTTSNATTAITPVAAGNSPSTELPVYSDEESIVLYYGSWSQDYPHGTGHMVYEDTSVYVGSFRQGARDGKGVYKLENGDNLVGVWSDNRLVKPLTNIST